MARCMSMILPPAAVVLASGERACDLVQSVSENDFSNEAFPYLTAQQVTIGDIPALALRVTYVGELGWEIYTPMEYGLKLWDTL